MTARRLLSLLAAALLGRFGVVPYLAETAEALEAHEKVMAEYGSVFRALAK